MTAAEEKALLSGWFDTVQFDVDYAGIPPMEDEDDDEESRSSQLIDWFQNIASGMPPEDIDEDIWSTLDEAALGMSRSTARSIYRQEMEFQQLFGRANPYHDEKGKFAKGSSGGGGIATSTKTANLSDTQAESLHQRLRTPDGGFTVDVRTGKDVTTGFAVATHEDRSVDIPANEIKGSHLQSFVDKNQDLFADERNKFGAWHDPDTGQVWLDVSTVVTDRGEAIELGKKHNQISIFHLDDFEVINTGGTGRSWLAWRNEQRVFGGGAPPKVMARFNPNHDKGGKFASHKGGHATPSPEEAKVAIKGGKEIARGVDRAVYHREGDYFAFKRATSRDGIASNDREMELYAEVQELGTGHDKVKVPEMARVDEKIIATQFIDGVPLSTLSTPEYNKLDDSAIRAASSLTNGDWHNDQVILDDKGNLWVVDLSGLGPEWRFNPNHDKGGKFASHKGGGSGGKSVAQAVSEGASDPNMLIMKQLDTYPFGSSWQASDNMEERAGGLWSESYAGHKKVTKAIANNKAGRPTLEGIDVEKGRHKYTLLQAGAEDLPDGTRTPSKYKKENLEADIRNSASVLQSKMDTAPIINTPLYRGMRVNRDKLPKSGDVIETPVSSWAKQRSNAEVYAYAREDASLGIVGDHAVVMRMVGSKKAADISDTVASGIIDDEHLVQGKIRVRRVTRKGKSVNIEVEQI